MGLETRGNAWQHLGLGLAVARMIIHSRIHNPGTGFDFQIGSPMRTSTQMGILAGVFGVVENIPTSKVLSRGWLFQWQEESVGHHRMHPGGLWPQWMRDMISGSPLLWQQCRSTVSRTIFQMSSGMQPAMEGEGFTPLYDMHKSLQIGLTNTQAIS